MDTQNSLLAAKILKPHGIKGALKIKVFFQNWPQLFNKAVDQKGNLMHITHSNLLNKVRDEYIIQITGINSVEATIPYIHQELFFPNSVLPKISDENIFYYYELIGLEIWDEEKNKIGIIKEIYDLKAGDIIVIELNMGRVVELPFENTIF